MGNWNLDVVHSGIAQNSNEENPNSHFTSELAPKQDLKWTFKLVEWRCRLAFGFYEF